jgi:hypothetical protein
MSVSAMGIRLTDPVLVDEAHSIFEVQLLGPEGALRDAREFRIAGNTVDRFTEREMSDFVAQAVSDLMSAWLDRHGM